MAEWIEPVLDWTRESFYNFGDLTRVENNTAVVAELISHFDTIPSITSVLNRNMKRIEFADSLNRIEGNQDLLRQRFMPSGWTENKVDWVANIPFDYNDAARLENNLALLYFYYHGNYKARPYCGMVTCGEEVI